MDNGLIFPYRRRTAHTESVVLTIYPYLIVTFGWHRGVGAWDRHW